MISRITTVQELLEVMTKTDLLKIEEALNKGKFDKDHVFKYSLLTINDLVLDEVEKELKSLSQEDHERLISDGLQKFITYHTSELVSLVVFYNGLHFRIRSTVKRMNGGVEYKLPNIGTL